MEHMDHTKYSGLEYAYHGNTFSGNAITLAAGLATINTLAHSPVYEHIDKLGNMARGDMNRIFEDAGFPAQAVGIGSMFCIHLTNKKPLKDISGFTHYDHAQYRRMFNFLLENEIIILLPEIMHGGVSYAHTEKDIKHLTNTVEEYVKSKS
jgi:glutamate-1-semialdehyde 2,1-aminomutase